MEKNFTVNWRNHGDWDIEAMGKRIFKIRTISGGVFVYNEDGRNVAKFMSLSSCMRCVVDYLMGLNDLKGKEIE